MLKQYFNLKKKYLQHLVTKQKKIYLKSWNYTKILKFIKSVGTYIILIEISRY